VGGTPSTNGGAEIVINLPQQINFGDQNGSTGHLTIDVNHQDNGSESVSIDFNRGSSNYQLVLNLFAQASDSAAQSSQLSLQA
jgi:hypothetical protein